jgi:coenzyme F420-reducing hydrogenase beta subunit
MGYDAENIDYLFYKHPRHIRRGKLEKPVLPISLGNRLKEYIFPIVIRLRNLGYIKEYTERRRRFEEWFSNHVKCGREYRNVEELYRDPTRYDVYMVGSDQVWNPRMFTNIKPYFLDFAPTGAKCVSYASSFGVSELSGEVFYKYKKWLKRFAYIGVREKKGEDIVKAMALGIEVKHVVDPTLLLTAEEWKKVEEEVGETGDLNGDRYLLLYDLIACEKTTATAKRIADERGLRIVRVGDGAYGPGEFLWLFAHAESIVTNSFHGTVFSVLNHKPFVTVIPKAMGNANRITSLLDSLGLNLDSLSANYAAVDERMEKLRADSIAFLRRSIEEPARKIEHKLPIACFAGINRNDKIRAESTSGGVFTALAEEVINRGGGVYGAAFTADFKSVRHVAAETNEALAPLRKSKYVWSDAVWAYKSVAEEVRKGRLVLFSGTPCQCAVIRKSVGENDKLITVDFVCHGTPKPELFRKYADELERRHGSNLIAYEFREKRDGWNFPRIMYRFENGIEMRVIPWLDPYLREFYLSWNLKEGCYKCPFANLERQSDITIADCWRVGASQPDWDDNRGISNILVNSVTGAQLIAQVRSRLTLHEYELDLAQARNHALVGPSVKAPRCRPNWYYFVVYWVKRIGWVYFKGKQ